MAAWIAGPVLFVALVGVATLRSEPPVSSPSEKAGAEAAHTADRVAPTKPTASITSTPPVDPQTEADKKAAKELRHWAFVAYEDDRYAEFLDGINKARRLDPAGESDEQVRTARTYAEQQVEKLKAAGSHDGGGPKTLKH